MEQNIRKGERISIDESTGVVVERCVQVLIRDCKEVTIDDCRIDHILRSVFPDGTRIGQLLSAVEQTSAAATFDRSGAVQRATDDIIPVSYRNHRGETDLRWIIPQSLRFGATDWHPDPQWLLECFDVDRDADRTFALTGCDFAAGKLLADAAALRLGHLREAIERPGQS